MKGSKADARVVLITSKLDSFAASFGLARGANAATGTALLLELARLLSIVYEDDSTRPRVTTIFALMPADSFNYMASKDYLTEVGRDGVEVFSILVSYNNRLLVQLEEYRLGHLPGRNRTQWPSECSRFKASQRRNSSSFLSRYARIKQLSSRSEYRSQENQSRL